MSSRRPSSFRSRTTFVASCGAKHDGGAAWTADIARALRVAGRIDAGQVYVNGYYSPAMSESPAVGHKKSGVGEAGYLKYTVPKTVFVRTA